MRILAITDGADWCLDHLTDLVVRHNPQFEFRVLKVHPKEVPQHLPEIEEGMKWADLVWHQYFRTGAQIAELLPDLVASKKHILTHHNQKDDVFKHDQAWVTHFACHTEKMKEKIQARYPKTPVQIIRHGIDLDEFSYDKTQYVHTKENMDFVVGYAGRTKPWKRLKNVVAAAMRAKETDVVGKSHTMVLGMGKRDDAYANEIDWSNPDLVWHENVPDEDRKVIYGTMSCFVQYSEDGIEEGTMPLLEAMACGIPVITSPVGTARDVIRDGESGLVVNNDDELKAAIERLRDDPKLCERLRANAWEVIKGFSEENMAWNYEKLFWKVYDHRDLVSVIIPTYKRPELLEEILGALSDQTYPVVEVVVADDDAENDVMWSIVEDWRKKYTVPIKYVRTGNPGYGLAQARNMGAIEATGHYLMFLDDRYKPDQEAVFKFVKALSNLNPKTWVFGNKGADKREFVENFGMIRRQDFFDMGMFNERITAYGGMSQEVRTRAARQNITLYYVQDAVAETIHETRRRAGRRSQIWRMKHQLKRMGL
jgi:glycosyltransferase involved in cell wall biosynthesis